MKCLFFCLFLLVSTNIFAQKDTVFIEKEAIIIEKQVYYIDSTKLINHQWVLGAGVGKIQKIENEPLLLYGNTALKSSFNISVQIGSQWEKKHKVLQTLFSVSNISYMLEVRGTEIKEEQVTDKYEVVLDRYYTIQNNDTVWFNIMEKRDTTYNKVTEEAYEKESYRERLEFALPIAIGYKLSFRNVNITPMVLVKAKIYTSKHNSNLVQVATGFTINMEYRLTSHTNIYVSPSVQKDIIRKRLSLTQTAILTGLKFIF